MRFRLAPALLTAVLGLSACREAKVATYRTAHETPEPLPPILSDGASPAATMPPANSMANTAVPTASGDGLSWTAPARWQVKPASAMRKGSYAIPGEGGAAADLSVTAFPGDVGGELANINRWRNQLELPPISEVDLPDVTTRVEHNGLAFVIVDLVADHDHDGKGTQRIVGALTPFGGATWFFKLMGPDALVASEKPAFLAFLETVKPPVATP